MSSTGLEINKTETEVRAHKVQFGRDLEFVWEPGKEYVVNSVVRPTLPNGFEYKCTTAGQSSSREPTWKKALAETVNDGSVIWTAQAVSGDGRDSIASINLESPAAITANSEAFSGTEVTFNVSGGTYDSTGDTDPYEVSVEATTVAGEVIEKKVFVKITGV